MSKLPWVTFDNLMSVDKANSGFFLKQHLA